MTDSDRYLRFYTNSNTNLGKAQHGHDSIWAKILISTLRVMRDIIRVTGKHFTVMGLKAVSNAMPAVCCSRYQISASHCKIY